MVAELNRKVGVAMASGSYSPDREERTDGLLAPAVGISIAIAIFAVVTQALAANGAISLNVTQQLTMWLVAAGLIVLAGCGGQGTGCDPKSRRKALENAPRAGRISRELLAGLDAVQAKWAPGTTRPT